MVSVLTFGAEAVLYFDGSSCIVTKKRIKKSYRVEELDSLIRKSRTKREKKVIEKLKGVIPVPQLLKDVSDDTFSEDDCIAMEFIKGDKISDILSLSNCNFIFKKIGKYIALMHNVGIIHGDLTTSNLIQSNKDVFIIDFGLSFFSDRLEDKAVDIHLLRQAIESKHPKLSKKAFSSFLNEYKKNSNTSKDILHRFEQVEQRGRNKKSSSFVYD